MTEEQKATRIEKLNESIKKLINIIDNYTEVERKIFTARREAFSEDDSRFYCIVPFIRLKERFKNASDNIVELEDIAKELLEIKENIERNEHQRWKNANLYKEPNNPQLQAEVNEILARGV